MNDLIILKSLYTKFASHKEGQWIMVWNNAQDLYTFIMEHDIKKVLDLGTGIGVSAAVMALAFKNKGVEDYKIDTIEQYDKCVNLAKILIPIELQKNMNIIKDDVMVWSTPEMPYQFFSVFKNLPEDDYDLIVNDGPAPFLEGENYIDLPNGTIHKLTMEGKIKTGASIVYDGRLISLKILERYFGDNFFMSHVAQRQSDFNVLEKRGNELKIVDDKLAMMKNQTNYFKDENTLSGNEPGPQSKTTTPAEPAK